mmetsp:Transcript_16496/g.45231  ORF Transcript_16496/g.45231 Transcript_16496/m.45231 type:complete len:232 (+) Transcript_16496:548-1243(+)
MICSSVFVMVVPTTSLHNRTCDHTMPNAWRYGLINLHITPLGKLLHPVHHAWRNPGVDACTGIIPGYQKESCQPGACLGSPCVKVNDTSIIITACLQCINLLCSSFNSNLAEGSKSGNPAQNSPHVFVPCVPGVRGVQSSGWSIHKLHMMKQHVFLPRWHSSKRSTNMHSLDGLINQNLQGVPGKGEIVIFKKNTQSGLCLLPRGRTVWIREVVLLRKLGYAELLFQHYNL